MKVRHVPWAVQTADRIPKQRYYDPEFYALEAELLWPRVWQMACRLEEIPKPGDYVEYEILGESVIVVRIDSDTVRAYHNACRHRGVKLVDGSGSCGSRRTFVCPFHGWCWALDGRNTHVARPEEFDEHNLDPDDLRLVSVRCELWGGCTWINLDDEAPPLRDCFEPFASIYDAWKVERLRVEWWQSCRLPVNWRLATAAFMEGYHVPQTHPQLLPSSRPGGPAGFTQTNLYFMRTLGEGMAGMVHENDIRIAEGLRAMELPADPAAAMATWRGALNDAVVDWHRARGCDMPDLNELERRGIVDAINFCFPHYFLLPQYSSASSYRIRPLGPEETLFEIWSLTRFPDDASAGRPTPPEPMAPDDPRWPPIPAQDFSNLPRQQKGLHSKGFEYMRLSSRIEGLISNFERVVDGFLAGLPYDALVPAIQKTNTTIDVPIVDLGLGLGLEAR